MTEINKRYTEYFDTVYDTGASEEFRHAFESEVQKEEWLFSGRRIGMRRLCNMVNAGLLDEGVDSFSVHKIRSQAAFDTDIEQAERLFALLEAQTLIHLFVGDRPFFKGYLKWEDSSRKEEAPLFSRSYSVCFEEPMCIPPRQNFAVDVWFSPVLLEALNAFKAQKSLRVFLCGLRHQDWSLL